jgi:ribonuclease E
MHCRCPTWFRLRNRQGCSAEAKATISAEPGPVHVPRERPSVAVSNEGPLVLVETKRDLRDMTLPFEKPAS